MSDTSLQSSEGFNLLKQILTPDHLMVYALRRQMGDQSAAHVVQLWNAFVESGLESPAEIAALKSAVEKLRECVQHLIDGALDESNYGEIQSWKLTDAIQNGREALAETSAGEVAL